MGAVVEAAAIKIPMGEISATYHKRDDAPEGAGKALEIGCCMVKDRAGGAQPSSRPGYSYVPFDATTQDLARSTLSGADLGAWLGATRSQTVIVIADTPHAAALQADLPSTLDSGRQLGLLASAGSLFGTPVARGQQVTLYTEALASGVRGAADLNRDGHVTLQELQNFAGTAVARATGGNQTAEARAGFGGYLPDLPLDAL